MAHLSNARFRYWLLWNRDIRVGEKVILSMVQLKLKEYLPVTRFEKKASLPET